MESQLDDKKLKLLMKKLISVAKRKNTITYGEVESPLTEKSALVKLSKQKILEKLLRGLCRT